MGHAASFDRGVRNVFAGSCRAKVRWAIHSSIVVGFVFFAAHAAAPKVTETHLLYNHSGSAGGDDRGDHKINARVLLICQKFPE